jgi:hypothetical protein
MKRPSILALVAVSACGGGEFTATQLRVLDAAPPGLEASGTEDGADPPDASKEAMGAPETGADAPDAILATDGQDGGRDAGQGDGEVADGAKEDARDSGLEKDSGHPRDSSDEVEAAYDSGSRDSGSLEDSRVVDSGSPADSYVADTWQAPEAGDEPDVYDSGATADVWDGNCALAHSDGVGNFYYDCSPLGTYNATTAMEACVAYASAMGLGQADCSDGWTCPGSSETFVCFSTNGTSPSEYCWEYSVNPGHVLVAACPIDFTGHLWN